MSDEQDQHDAKELVQVSTNTPEPELPNEPDEASSRFSKNEKWFIVIFTAFVGLFSPLTANIYFPAIPTLSIAFNKSTELINLTVTMYIVLQGIAPMLWGPVADHVGRRPISAACLLILSLSCIGLALVPTSEFWLLMLLRCLQAVGAGVIGDISNRAERGGFFGIFTLGPTSGPAIGPVIGGALAGSLGWRSIFWFLCISASVCLLFIILFQPETLPPLVDSGRDRTFLVYQPDHPSVTPKTNTPRNPFRLFLNPDVVLMLAINGIMFTVFYGVCVPFLSQTTVGFCFLAIGGGTVVGSCLSGRILDFEYQRFKKKAREQYASNVLAFDITQEGNFPLEMARLNLTPYYILTLAASCAGYGWCVENKVNIAVPLILQFLAGCASIGVMNATSTLNIDLVPGQSSSVTACNNFVRGCLTALLVSVVQLIINGIGIGWTYVLLSGLSLLALPLVYIAIRIGPRYRVKRQRLREGEQGRTVEIEKQDT
ncbi:MFS general substrate transporter [Flammula alnicola]|nr:MFS general substrate transporter [Flammula alnicola]